MMPSKTNPKCERRYLRTEKMLRESLISLLFRNQIQDITVSQLAAHADLNRSTFYLHYTDIYDLLETMENDLFCELRSAVEATWQGHHDANHFFRFLAQAFTILQRNARFCMALIRQKSGTTFFQQLEKLFYAEGFRTLKSYAPNTTAPQDLQYAVDFAIAGCMGMIQRWFTSSCIQTPEHMAHLALTLLRKGTISMDSIPAT